jgi:DNA repair exonuclease SbcCD ATPase subunit
MKSYILAELTIHNFGPFKGTHKLVDIDLRTLIGVVGEYDGVKGKSNRSGKSMFLEVFTYLLTGKSRADTEVELIHDGEDAMFVEGLFVNEHDGEDYKRVKRGRTTAKQNSGMLEVDWIEKSKDAKQAIIDTFGVGDDFEITAFFKQSDIEGFMKKKPAEQSEDMMKWMDNGHWPERAERVKKDIKTFRDRLKDTESAKRALETSLESSDALQVQIDQKNLEADASDKKLQEVEGGLSVLVDEQKVANDKLAEINIEKKAVLSKIQEANRNEREINRIKTNVQNYSTKLNRIQAEVEDDFKGFTNTRADIVTISEELGSLDSSMSHLKGLIVGISSSKGVCPILGSQCDAISSTGSIVDYQAQHDELLKEYNACKNELRDTKRLVQLLDEVDDYNKKLDESNKDLSKLGAIDLTEVNKQLIKLEAEVSKKKEFLSIVQGSINEVNAVADAHSDKVKDLESDIKVLKHRLSVFDETLAKITEKDETASKLRLVIADLSDIAIMFSKYGIPADEIDNSLGTIQDKVNMILKLAGLDLSMNFSPDKEISGREPVCICGHHFVKNFRGGECPDCGMARQNKRKTEMTIKIIEDGKERKFKMDSGGGKTLIAFAVRIAINLIKREQGKMSLNMLFLDEVDAPFDDFHLNKLITIITTTLVKSFKYRQIILISHNAKIRDSIDDIIKVVRYSDNTSKVSFEN